MNIGYARTSTIEQAASFEAQQSQLKAAGCQKVFCEQVSAVAPEREELESALEYAREGDVLVVTKLDRLARSVPHLCAIGQATRRQGRGVKGPRPGNRHDHANRQAHVQYAGGYRPVRT